MPEKKPDPEVMEAPGPGQDPERLLGRLAKPIPGSKMSRERAIPSP